MNKKWLSALALSAISPLAAAQWSAGVAVLIPGSPYLDADTEIIPIPIIAYEGERLTWRGPSLQYELLDPARNTPSLRLSVQLAPNELEVEDNPQLTGLDDRDFSFMAGVVYAYPTRLGTLSASVATEVTNKHDGQRATVSWDHNIATHPQRKWAITGGVEVEYLSDNYADYYFGVSAVESMRTAFSEYTVDAVFQPAATLGGYYSFNERWRAAANFRLQRLADDVKNSPIVESSTSFDGFVGLTYSF